MSALSKSPDRDNHVKSETNTLLVSDSDHPLVPASVYSNTPHTGNQAFNHNHNPPSSPTSNNRPTNARETEGFHAANYGGPDDYPSHTDYGSDGSYQDIHKLHQHGYQHHHDHGQTHSHGNGPNLFQLVGIAAATAATLGYDVGIMAAAIQPLETQLQLSSIQKELAMGSLNFVAAGGALIGGNFANEHGRKPTIKLCSWLFVVGTVCMALAPSYLWLLLGRIITGLGVGVSFVVAPVYLSEVAPSEQRGELNTVFDVAINGGILLGYVIGFLIQVLPPIFFLGEESKWRVMLGLGLVLPAIVLFFLAHLPESPRYLVMKNHLHAAETILTQLGDDDSRQTVESIRQELIAERQQAAAIANATPKGANGSRRNAPVVVLSPIQLIWNCIISCGRNISPSLKLALGLGFWNQATGTEAVLYYSSDFLERAGLQSATQRLLGNVAVGLCKLMPELVAMKLVDRVGRRPLLLTSAICLMIAMAALSLSFKLEWSPMFVVVLLCLAMSSYSIGIGPFSFLLATESLSLSERATGVTMCAAINRSTSGLVALTAVSLYQSLGESGFFGFYAFMGALSLYFFAFVIPETSGQTLEEIAASNRSAALASVRGSLEVSSERQSMVSLEME